MKVLHVVASLFPTWGGPVPVVKGLTEAMVKKGLNVAVFAPVVQGSPHGAIQLEGVEECGLNYLDERRAYILERAETLCWEVRL